MHATLRYIYRSPFQEDKAGMVHHVPPRQTVHGSIVNFGRPGLLALYSFELRHLRAAQYLYPFLSFNLREFASYIIEYDFVVLPSFRPSPADLATFSAPRPIRRRLQTIFWSSWFNLSRL